MNDGVLTQTPICGNAFLSQQSACSSAADIIHKPAIIIKKPIIVVLPPAVRRYTIVNRILNLAHLGATLGTLSMCNIIAPPIIRSQPTIIIVHFSFNAHFVAQSIPPPTFSAVKDKITDVQTVSAAATSGASKTPAASETMMADLFA